MEECRDTEKSRMVNANDEGSFSPRREDEAVEEGRRNGGECWSKGTGKMIHRKN